MPGEHTTAVTYQGPIGSTWRAQHELEEGYEKYLSLFEGVPVGLFRADPDGSLIEVNGYAVDMLGYEDKSHLLGRKVQSFLAAPGSNRPPIDMGSGGEIELELVRQDGGTCWVTLSLRAVRDSSGALAHYEGAAIDITRRKRAEAELEFRGALLDQMRAPVVVTDRRGAITQWNARAEQDYGWSAEEALGAQLLDLVVPELDGDVKDEIEGSLARDGLWEGEVTITHKDGSSFPAWTSGAVVNDSRGRPAGVVGVMVDLSDVTNAREQARIHRELSNSLMESVSLPIAVFDSEGGVLASNPSWGPPASELDSAATRFLPKGVSETVSARTVADVEQGVSRVLSGDRDEFSLEYSYQRADVPRWLRAVAVPARGSEGAVVAHWDISDEVFARTALEETIRAKDDFIASVSHELRTPLSVVVGLAEMLRNGTIGDNEIGEFHGLIADQAQEMALIVEDLLVAGRLDSDTLTIRPTIIDVADEAATVLRIWQSVESGLRLEIASGDAKAYADSLRVRQIFRNLLINAVRYGAPPIVVSASQAEDDIHIEVIDHGDGVPPEAVQRMFEPYSHFGDITGLPSSVGLGLHVARRLARLMGGDLAYRREPGRTRFVLTLPKRLRRDGQDPQAA